MSVQFKINVTKEILESSQECGSHNDIERIGEKCAIALALKDIFPEVFVTGNYIYPLGIQESTQCDDIKIAMPKVAQDFIQVFDSLCFRHKRRLLLPEFEFEIS